MNRTSYSSGNHSPGNVLLYIQLINLAVILIIAVLGFYLCSYYYNTVRKDFYAENRLYLDNVASAHENELQILKDNYKAGDYVSAKCVHLEKDGKKTEYDIKFMLMEDFSGDF